MVRWRAAVALSLSAAIGVAVFVALGPLHGTTNSPPPLASQVRMTCQTDDPDEPCAFIPRSIMVRSGTTVRWTNDEAVFHTVTSTESPDVLRPSGLFDHSLSRAGESFEFTFLDEGTFHYYCQVHSEFMTGTVVVLA